MKNPRDIIIEPVVSEKAYDGIDNYNSYTFLVDRRASKPEIRLAIESIFEVEVAEVDDAIAAFVAPAPMAGGYSPVNIATARTLFRLEQPLFRLRLGDLGEIGNRLEPTPG